MLRVGTIIKPSPIHGLGCFLCENILKGATVWVFHPEIDHVLEIPWARSWEWQHGYRTKDGRLILPRDNSAFMNFNDPPSLVEGPVINGEPSLEAAWDLILRRRINRWARD